MSADYMEALRVQLSWAADIAVSGKPGYYEDLIRETEGLHVLRQGTPIFVADWAGRGVVEAAKSLPRSLPLLLEDLPCDCGFALLRDEGPYRRPQFESPDDRVEDYIHAVRNSLPLPKFELIGYKSEPLSAIGWRVCPINVTGRESDPSEMGVYLHAWLGIAPGGSVGYGNSLVFPWVFGHPIGHGLDDDDAYQEFAGQIGGVAYALWAFMREKRATTVTHRGVDRALRKQAERAGWTHEPIVQVVELRAAESRPHDPDAAHAAVDWACRWVVRGHWHKYAYSDGALRARWVAAYVKGPAGKPLRSATKLLAVVR